MTAKKAGRGKPGEPWFWKARGQWAYRPPGGPRTVIRDAAGNPVTGEDNRTAAIAAWGLMRAMGSAPETKGEGFPLRVALELYLQDRERRGMTGESLRGYAARYASLLRSVGDIPASALTPKLVEKWWADNPQWGPSTRGRAGAAVSAALVWAAAPGGGGRLIPDNPIRGMRFEGTKVRTAAVVCSEDEFRRVLAATKHAHIRDVLTVLWRTGARPVQLTRATAANVTADGRALVFDADNTGGAVHKAYRKTRRALSVPLDDVAAAIVARLAARYPTGPLFRTATGRGWVARDLSHRIGTLARRVGLGGRFTGYSARHSLATDLISRGASIAEVAAVLGNTVGVADRNYNKAGSIPAAQHAILTRLRPTT